MTALVPLHVPVPQTSLLVQAFPSSHAVAAGLAGFEHAPVVALHTPTVWHWSDAVHTLAVPTQAPVAPQASSVVQALPSLQVAPAALRGFEHIPVAVSHVPAMWH